MSPDAASAEELIQQARKGDVAALDELLTRCRVALSDFAEERLPDEDAETIGRLVGQTLQAAARDFEHCSSESETQFQGWLEGILERHQADLDALTTKQGFRADDATLPGSGPPPRDLGDGGTLVGDANAGTAASGDSPQSEFPDGFGAMETMAGGDATQTGDKKLPEGFDSMDTIAGATSAKGGRSERPFSSDKTVVGGTAATPNFAPTSARRFGKYELLSVIAKGGMGVVHKARDTKLNRIVALKMILSGQFADDVEIDRFYTEAESAARLRHANIVAIHEVGEAEGQHFFAMDFIDGQSLSDLIRENPLPPRRAAELVTKITEAMQYAHAEGILHRDLKPSNVLLDQSLEPMITDFGLAKQIEGQSQLTMSGAIVGTPSYMPPEQASGKLDEVSVRSDVYSLGAILYELATGRPLFRAANPFETIKQVLNNEPIPLRMLNPSVPVDLETVCLKCLQKEPARRYASAQELADELRRFLAGEPIQARPVGPTERFFRWCRRNPRIASLSAAVVVSLLLTVVVLIVSNVRTSAALAEADESFRQAREAVDELFTKVSEDVLFNQPGMQHVRKDLLQQAMKYYERFLDQRENDTKVQDELGETLYRMGQITELIDSPAEGLTFYNRARERQQRLLALKSSVARLDNLGDTWNAIGRASVRTRDHDASLHAYGEAVGFRKQLVEQYAAHRDRIEFLRKLASSEMNMGVVFRELGAAADGKDDVEQADEHFASALRHFEKAQRIRNDALDGAANDRKLRRDLGKGYYNMANLALMMQEDALAQQHIDNAVDTVGQLIVDDPSDLENKHLHANCIRRAADFRGIFGDIHFEDEQFDLAKQEWRAALSLENTALQKMEELARNNPIVIFYKGDQAGILLNMGLLHTNLEESKEALSCFERARDILAPLVDQYPVPRYAADLEAALAEIEALKK